MDHEDLNWWKTPNLSGIKSTGSDILEDNFEMPYKLGSNGNIVPDLFKAKGIYHKIKGEQQSKVRIMVIDW